MRLTVVLLTGCTSLCLTLAQDQCRQGEQCVSTDKCPDYLVSRKKLSSYRKNITRYQEEYEQLLAQLRSRVCNQHQRKICCGKTAEEEDVAQLTEDCGLQQLTTGFVRPDQIQSWFTI